MTLEHGRKFQSGDLVVLSPLGLDRVQRCGRDFERATIGKLGTVTFYDPPQTPRRDVWDVAVDWPGYGTMLHAEYELICRTRSLRPATIRIDTDSLLLEEAY